MPVKPTTESEQMDRLIDSTEVLYQRIVARGYDERIAQLWAVNLMIVSRLEVVAAETQESYETMDRRLFALNEMLAVTTLANVKAASEVAENIANPQS